MKKIAFTLIFMLLLQGAVFAEGETAENSVLTETAASVEAEVETEAETEEIAETETETETAPEAEFETEALTDTETEPEPEPKDNGIHFVDLYVFGNGVTLSSYPVFVGNTLMLPIQELLSHLGANDFSVDSENQITITYGKKIVAMYLDSNKAFLNRREAELPAAPFLVGDVVYAPAEIVCKALGFMYRSTTNGDKMTLYTDTDLPADTTSTSVTQTSVTQSAENRVNGMNLSSETPYLIWVNKSEYTVYVFLGSKNNWRQVYSCKCAIGAPSSPTVTGTFKYFSLESRWSYAKFYVGPVMRFHGGYAIHSTLLKYDGSDYNNSVGVKISHGCVRVRPDDIAWLVSYVPLKTTVHVTEK